MQPRQKYLRESIRAWLSLLRRELGHYEQTTHGSMSAHRASMECVLEGLQRCYDDPTSLNISELSQRITAFLGEDDGEKQ